MTAGAPRRLSSAFATGRPALVAYLMAGYPDRATSAASIRAAVEAGADLIELGVPYADPLADGPAIVAAAEGALAAGEGAGLAATIALAAEIDAGDAAMVPIALMTYLNPVLRFGLARAAGEMAAAGVAGVIIPDMLPDSPFAATWRAAAEPLGLDTVFLAAPTSTPQRLQRVARASSGFVYCVSSVGVTGERGTIAESLPALVDDIRRAREPEPPIPVAVGFGVSGPEMAARIASFADGVIVGSAIVKRQTDPEAVREFVGPLAEAVHGARADAAL